MLAAAAAVAEAEGLLGDGFRLVFNTGGYAGQEVFHVHAHVLGGAARPDAGPMTRRRCALRARRPQGPGRRAGRPALSVALHRADREPGLHGRHVRQPDHPLDAGSRSGSAR